MWNPGDRRRNAQLSLRCVARFPHLARPAKRSMKAESQIRTSAYHDPRIASKTHFLQKLVAFTQSYGGYFATNCARPLTAFRGRATSDNQQSRNAKLRPTACVNRERPCPPPRNCLLRQSGEKILDVHRASSLSDAVRRSNSHSRRGIPKADTPGQLVYAHANRDSKFGGSLWRCFSLYADGLERDGR
jgi:hypothetical protein